MAASAQILTYKDINKGQSAALFNNTQGYVSWDPENSDWPNLLPLLKHKRGSHRVSPVLEREPKKDVY